MMPHLDTLGMIVVTVVTNVGITILPSNTITRKNKKFLKMLSMETEVTPYVLKTPYTNLYLSSVLSVVLSTLLLKNPTLMIVVETVFPITKSKLKLPREILIPLILKIS